MRFLSDPDGSCRFLDFRPARIGLSVSRVTPAQAFGEGGNTPMRVTSAGLPGNLRLSPCSVHPAKNRRMRRSRAASPIKICICYVYLRTVLHISQSKRRTRILNSIRSSRRTTVWVGICSPAAPDVPQMPRMMPLGHRYIHIHREREMPYQGTVNGPLRHVCGRKCVAPTAA